MINFITKNKKIILIVSAVILGLALLTFILVKINNSRQAQITVPQNNNGIKTNTGQTNIANPASVNCKNKGGNLTIQTKPDGSQYGLCYFEDNRACEEWALMRGDCPVGGVKTTGYSTDQQKYCAWVGGQTTTVANAICTFKDKTVCSLDDLYNGACQAGNYKIEKTLSQVCAKNSDCQTPAEYLLQSRCPFTSQCLGGKCTVVCPKFK
jgi:putative hemolysin